MLDTSCCPLSGARSQPTQPTQLKPPQKVRLLELPALLPSGATNAASRTMRSRSRMARDVGLHLRPSTQKIISACLLSVLFRLPVPIRLLASACSTKFKILCVRSLALCIRLMQSDQNMFMAPEIVANRVCRFSCCAFVSVCQISRLHRSKSERDTQLPGSTERCALCGMATDKCTQWTPSVSSSDTHRNKL